MSQPFTFYLWKMDASTSYQPKLRGQVTLDGGAIRVEASEDPELERLVQEVGSRPALPFKGETMVGEGDDRRMVLQQVEVHPGEPQYGIALSQAVGRAGRYSISFTPEPV